MPAFAKWYLNRSLSLSIRPCCRHNGGLLGVYLLIIVPSFVQIPVPVSDTQLRELNNRTGPNAARCGYILQCTGGSVG